MIGCFAFSIAASVSFKVSRECVVRDGTMAPSPEAIDHPGELIDVDVDTDA